MEGEGWREGGGKEGGKGERGSMERGREKKEKVLHERAEDGSEGFDNGDNERTKGNRTQRCRHGAVKKRNEESDTAS